VCHRFRLSEADDYFGSIFTTFESSSIIGGGWDNIENWLEPKTEPPSGTLAFPNP